MGTEPCSRRRGRGRDQQPQRAGTAREREDVAQLDTLAVDRGRDPRRVDVKLAHLSCHVTAVPSHAARRRPGGGWRDVRLRTSLVPTPTRKGVAMCGTNSAVGLSEQERVAWPLLRDRLRRPGQLMGLMRGVLGGDAEVAAVVTTTPSGIARPIAIP